MALARSLISIRLLLERLRLLLLLLMFFLLLSKPEPSELVMLLQHFVFAIYDFKNRHQSIMGMLFIIVHIE
jgi:hypothetical protein